MSWITWIILGGFAGWAVGKLTTSNARGGIVGNIIIGVIGALTGSWILGFLGIAEPLSFNLMTFFISIGGAVVLLTLVNMLHISSRRK